MCSYSWRRNPEEKPKYLPHEKRLIKANPKLRGARRRAKQLIQESSQDKETKQEMKQFIG